MNSWQMLSNAPVMSASTTTFFRLFGQEKP